jgi:hypothetical protein
VSRPLGLTDSQFTMLINSADQLHPVDRDPFLRAVAHRFSGRSDELGDGEFGRGLRELLRSGFFKPPIGLPSTEARSRRKVGSALA